MNDKPTSADLEELAIIADHVHEMGSNARLAPPLMAALGAFIIIEAIRDMEDEIIEARAEVLRQAMETFLQKLPEEADFLDAIAESREASLN
jgi:hypothetical protein